MVRPGIVWDPPSDTAGCNMFQPPCSGVYQGRSSSTAAGCEPFRLQVLRSLESVSQKFESTDEELSWNGIVIVIYFNTVVVALSTSDSIWMH